MSDQPSLPPPEAAPAPATGYAPPTNTLAILALVLSFIVSIAGIICGHLALAQIKRTGEAGRELALAGLIVGYVTTGLGILIAIASIVFTFGWLAVVGTLVATYGTR